MRLSPFARQRNPASQLALPPDGRRPVGRAGTKLRLAMRIALLPAIAAMGWPAAAQQQWQPLAKDGLRDPAGPAVNVLQQPGEALSRLAPDSAGNQVRWVKALEQGQINPRSNLKAETKVQYYDKDMLLNLKGGMPVVRFSHGIHTKWLDCSNCHEHLFKKQAAATKISMFLILQGEQCGVCHGAVAFPLTECSRCHNTKRADALMDLERDAQEKGIAPPAPGTLPTAAVAPTTRPAPAEFGK